MNRKAVIDIGTNSIKMFVAEMAPNGSLTKIIDVNNIARLGEGMGEEGLLKPEAIARNVEAVDQFVKQAAASGAGQIVAVGTMALRTAKNAAEFIDAVKTATGIDVRVIPGEVEAHLSYLAAVSGLGPHADALAVCDVGGGSSEFVFGRGAEVDRRLSINLGAVRVTDRFLTDDPPGAEQVEEAKRFIMDELEAGGVRGEVGRLVGIGGTVTSLGAVKFEMVQYDADRIQGAILTAADVDRLIELFISMPLERRRTITGLQPKRAEVIVGGACILRCIMQQLGVAELTMSDRGLRHGLMFQLFSEGSNS
ncbi:MAG: Ppx/GppA phosphatase family protein [Bacillota bacterium]|jgi:exopolyphosphatase/guanosine-5'-triphosphate,3'-diphosphate pyrophosphatase|nr:Ppx/GppA family phosphatase [Bacillota bacterium]